MHELEPSLTQVQNRNASSNRQQTAVTRDLRRAEDKIKRHVRAYKRARQALECLKAPNEVMDTYRPILPEDLNVSGDVVEENRLGQRNDTLAWFWHIQAPNGDQGDQWMEECESSNMIAYAIDLNKKIKFTGSTGCGPRHGLIGGKKKKS
jgi:hypothetical protein